MGFITTGRTGKTAKPSQQHRRTRKAIGRGSGKTKALLKKTLIALETHLVKVIDGDGQTGNLL